MKPFREAFANFWIIVVPVLFGVLIGVHIDDIMTIPFRVEVVESFENYQDNFIRRKINIMAVKQPFSIASDIYEDYNGILYPVVFAGENAPIEIEYIKHYEIRIDYYRIIYCDNGRSFETEYRKPLNPPGTYILENKIISGYMDIPADVSQGVPCTMFMPTTFFNGLETSPELTASTQKFIVRSRDGT